MPLQKLYAKLSWTGDLWICYHESCLDVGRGRTAQGAAIDFGRIADRLELSSGTQPPGCVPFTSIELSRNRLLVAYIEPLVYHAPKSS